MHWRDIISGQAQGVVPAVTRGVLRAASTVYRLVMRLRNTMYDRGWKPSVRVPIPVISVGNLTVGGTGKTPTVAMLARWFRARGIRVAIVSRGYGAGPDGRNDEARELESLLNDVPHLQNPDRVAAATVACEELEMQAIVLDDGFQHRRLARDLDIVLLDASNPFGYGYLLPRGLLRESPRALARADVVMLTRCDLVSAQQLADIRNRVQRIAPKAAWVETEHRPIRLRNASQEQLPIDWLRNRRCLVFSGIGNPAAFIETVRRCEATILASHAFKDHHAYAAVDMAQLDELVRSHLDIECVICTGKDLAKIEVDRLADRPLWMLEIELTVRAGQEALDDRLAAVCQGHRDRHV